MSRDAATIANMSTPVLRLRWLLLATYSSIAAAACAGASDSHTVFDPRGSMNSAANVLSSSPSSNEPRERPYPPLDLPQAPGPERWVGVSVLRDGVVLSRPTHWVIRDASSDPGHAYIQYISPKAYSFAIYERSDAPTDLWRDVQERYELDVAAVGGKVLGQRIPTATSANQGRAYTIERKVDAAPVPIVSRSREILLRSDHRIVLIQIVTQDDGLSKLSDELLAVLGHLEVL